MQWSSGDIQLIQFLQAELFLSDEAIDMAVRHRDAELGFLPMILWQYGLVSIEQLSRIFDQQEAQIQSLF